MEWWLFVVDMPDIWYNIIDVTWCRLLQLWVQSLIHLYMWEVRDYGIKWNESVQQ